MPDHAALAEFRYQLRQFLKKSELEAQRAGLEPQQHQLLLAIKGLPLDDLPTVGRLADRLFLKHHSTVGLVDRLEKHGLVQRSRDLTDQRRVLVQLTPEGERMLDDLSLVHENELNSLAPALMRSLRAVVRSSRRRTGSPSESTPTP